MNNVYTLLQAPRPAGGARATSIPEVVCKERATKPAGLRTQWGGAGRPVIPVNLRCDENRAQDAEAGRIAVWVGCVLPRPDCCCGV